jgi:hypothetical protein
MKDDAGKIIFAGLLGGFLGNGVSGLIFSTHFIESILYNPSVQSKLFLEITPLRNIPLSVSGLVILSVIHSWLFLILMPSVPGNSWLKKGLSWGFIIWLMFWVFQEWFIYHTLLGEPFLLNLLELALLLPGSLVEGIIIARILACR